jgi:hypothetical protein
MSIGERFPKPGAELRAWCLRITADETILLLAQDVFRRWTVVSDSGTGHDAGRAGHKRRRKSASSNPHGGWAA